MGRNYHRSSKVLNYSKNESNEIFLAKRNLLFPIEGGAEGKVSIKNVISRLVKFLKSIIDQTFIRQSCYDIKINFV